MDASREIFAVIYAVTNLLMCGVWWFMFSRFTRVRIFLFLAILYTAALIFDAQNVYLAFNDKLLIQFENSRDALTYLEAVSYIGMAIHVAEAFAYLLLVKWILRNIQKK
jgi:hypothetical protein